MDTLSEDLLTAMSKRGFEVIGDNQRTIAYTVVASGGAGLLNITAAAHGLKKGQHIYIGAGAYTGIHRIIKVVSDSIIQVAGTFGATASGNIDLVAATNGSGFIVNKATGLVINEFEAEDPNFDNASLLAKIFNNNEVVPVPFKKIRVSVGDITVVPAPLKADLDYTNR